MLVDTDLWWGWYPYGKSLLRDTDLPVDAVSIWEKGVCGYQFVINSVSQREKN